MLIHPTRMQKSNPLRKYPRQEQSRCYQVAMRHRHMHALADKFKAVENFTRSQTTVTDKKTSAETTIWSPPDSRTTPHLNHDTRCDNPSPGGLSRQTNYSQPEKDVGGISGIYKWTLNIEQWTLNNEHWTLVAFINETCTTSLILTDAIKIESKLQLQEDIELEITSYGEERRWVITRISKTQQREPSED